MANDNGTPPPDPPPPPPLPLFHGWFAIAAGIVGLVLVATVFGDPFMDWLQDGRAGFSDEDWMALEPGVKVGVTLTVPALLLGGFLVVVGLWMAVVEWRGRFKKPEDLTVEGVVDIPALVEALGKLQGAALVMIVGAVLMLAAAWVAQSAAAPPPTEVSPSTEPTS